MIGIIPARIGSKGILKKNIRKVGGIPLISWTIRNALKSKSLKRLIISTDDNITADIARKEGCEVPFIRPANLATDESKTSDLIMHAITELKLKDQNIMLLQPTSPLRRISDIEKTAEIFINNKNAYSVISMVNANVSREIQYLISTNNTIKRAYPSLSSKSRRQDCEIVYKPNGAIYVFNSDYFKIKQTFIDKTSLPYIMPKFESLDIDNLEDLNYLEYLSTKNKSIIPDKMDSYEK